MGMARGTDAACVAAVAAAAPRSYGSGDRQPSQSSPREHSDAKARGTLRDVVVGEDADRSGDAAAEGGLSIRGEDAEEEPARDGVLGERGGARRGEVSENVREIGRIDARANPRKTVTVRWIGNQPRPRRSRRRARLPGPDGGDILAIASRASPFAART